MGTEIEVRLKQDFSILKPQNIVPSGGENGVLFVDSTDGKLKYRGVNDGAIHIVDLENAAADEAAAQLVQEQIAQLARETAKAGENTDIRSLGMLQQPLRIKGHLVLENVPRFKLYATADQNFTSNAYTKAIFSETAHNFFCEIEQSKFVCSVAGIWSIKICLYMGPTANNSHVYLEVFINSLPYTLLSTTTLNSSGAHILSGVLEAELKQNDFVEVFVYSTGQSSSVVELDFPQRCFFSGRRVA